MYFENEINLGPRVKKQRINMGFSQANLSKSIGISASYLNLIESGKRKIPISLLIKVADKLNLSIKDFSVESNKRLLSDVMEVLSNEIFDDLKIKRLEPYFDSPITLAKKFSLRGIPTSILFNKDGFEFARIVGSIDFNNKEFLEWLKKYN